MDDDADRRAEAEDGVGDACKEARGVCGLVPLDMSRARPPPPNVMVLEPEPLRHRPTSYEGYTTAPPEQLCAWRHTFESIARRDGRAGELQGLIDRRAAPRHWTFGRNGLQERGAKATT